MQVFRHFTANGVSLKPFDFKRELSMQAYLIENLEVLNLDNLSFRDAQFIAAEVSIINGRQSQDKNGRIDVLAGYPEDGYIAVIELKLGELQESHLKQLEDYLSKTDEITKKYIKDLEEFSSERKWIGILVGESIGADLAKKIKDGYSYDEIPIAALTIQRFMGDGSVYVATDTYFKDKRAKKDRSKYSFGGTEYGKGRLVLAVLKKYVEDNPSTTFADLENKFPQRLQGSKGVFSTSADAKKKYNDTGYKRHYLNPEELIKLSDSTIAISTQWGIGNIKNFIQTAEELNFKIESS